MHFTTTQRTFHIFQKISEIEEKHIIKFFTFVEVIVCYRRKLFLFLTLYEKIMGSSGNGVSCDELLRR